ncbi:adenosylcobinamide-phosphate synthase CbiB [Sphingobium cloacae]|uniref:Cobalamin biosynthesis protein CobD n=1 Tax=Sphingobium cloacae TaxID=120107 RepID=A0A1E1F088_9SPHN|nr:adenosylcobinamide-phosphate synthase CbiB [Sphingobium cloacae]BAV63948.1 adenosylcobinamide-phosphate synthase [Sphingobium cloacae]
MAEPIAFAALALDAVIGWPRALYARIGHPVGFFARIITLSERYGNQARWSAGLRRAIGVLTVMLLLAVSAGGALLLEGLCRRWLGSLAWLGMAILAWPALAQRSLFEHVRPIARHLGEGDEARARQDVSMIVGRDTETLDEPGIARAAIESLSESFCDGVAAPLFWLIVGGLPGIWAYKAINTADSLIGHKEERWRAFGWAAARTDDVMNFLPARLGGAVICLAGGGGWRIMWRDARKHASPNAGWTEAAMAGTLGLRLAGPVSYDGVAHDKPWIGEGRDRVFAQDIQRALRVYLRACAILWIGAAAMPLLIR